MTVVGTVEKIKGNTVVVRTKRPASCEHCPTASVCNKKEIRMNIPNTVGAKIGDTVRVYIENDGSALGVLAYMFLTPLLILAAGYALFLLHRWLVLFAIALLIPYYIGLRFFNKSFGTKAYISDILPDGYNDELCN